MGARSPKTKKVYNLSKELNLSSDLILIFLRKKGFEISNHMSVVSDEMQLAIDSHFKKEKDIADRHNRRVEEFRSGRTTTSTSAPEQTVIEDPPRLDHHGPTLITLSEHARSQATRLAESRAIDYQTRLEDYRQKLDQRFERIQEAKAELSDAWKRREFGNTFRKLGGYLSARFSSKPSQPYKASPGEQEIIWNAGVQGEQLVASTLDNLLTSEWFRIAGYGSPKGEIDMLLVGPLGVATIEVKNQRGVIHCDGDRWWRDKYDRYGNLVEPNLPIVDNRGRGPSSQLNEAADYLQALLARRTKLKKIRRVIVFSHDNSKIGDLTHLTVDAVITLKELSPELLFGSKPELLRHDEISGIDKKIQNDHRSRVGRKPGRSS